MRLDPVSDWSLARFLLVSVSVSFSVTLAVLTDYELSFLMMNRGSRRGYSQIGETLALGDVSGLK